MTLFKKSPGQSQEIQEPKLILGTAEKLYPNQKNNINPLRLNYSRRVQHALVLGMTGSGKTESVLINFASQDIEKKYSTIIFDGKGDYSTFSKIYAFSHQLNFHENVYFFAANENKDISETYNPLLSDVSATRKTEMIMKSFFEYNPEQSTDATNYYKGQARAILAMAITILEAQNQPYNFKDIYYLLTETRILKKLLETTQTSLPTHIFSQTKTYLQDTEKDRQNKISGLMEKLSLFIEDQHLNTYNPTLKISDILDTSKTLFVSLSATEKEQVIGKLILQDIQNTLQTRQTSRQITEFPAGFLYLDEFSSYIYDGFLLILNKARSANISITIMTQSYGDLSRLGESFAQSLLDNTGIKIILKQDSIENSQISRLLGQTIHHKLTQSWKHDEIGKRITEEYDYIARPEEIRALLPGQAICNLPLQDGIGIYKTQLFWKQELQNTQAITYTPRNNQETQGINLEQQVKEIYQND